MDRRRDGGQAIGRRILTVIVGGGSAGCVLAARLSEDADRDVLLVEAGPIFAPDDYPADLTGPAPAIEPRRVWGYRSVPGRSGHEIAAHAGKVLGGGSAINAGIAKRARPSDFARWGSGGLNDWSHATATIAYRRLESSDIDDPEWHGDKGPWPIRQGTADQLVPPVLAFVRAAGSSLGLPWVADWNGPHEGGVGCEVKNIVDGVKINAGIAYLTAQVRARPNLTIRGDTMVDRIDLGDGRATGIRLASGETVAADAVILSAGVYGSPAILLRSGIGPAAHLEALGIEVKANLPVGEALRDQPMITVGYRLREGVRTDPPGGSGIVWTRSTLAEDDELDLQLSLSVQPDLDEDGVPVRNLRIWSCVVTPRGTGTVRLKSRDPYATPRIDYRLLENADDRKRLREAVRLMQRVMDVPEMADMVDLARGPDVSIETDADLEQALHAGAQTFYHGVSTAPMGETGDGRSVVDTTGRVHGVNGLRVVDASIIPAEISVAVNLTVLMIAERIAGFIRDGAFDARQAASTP